MSFAEIFAVHSPKEIPVQVIENQEDKRRRILIPIEQLFEKKLGKQKADAVKGKMMPTIERIYSRVMNVRPSEAAHTGRTAIQEFLTSYLEAISDLDALSSEQKPEAPTHHEPEIRGITDSGIHREDAMQPTHREEVMQPTHHEELQATLGVVGSKQGDEKQAVEEIKRLEAQEMSEEHDPVSKLPSTFLKRAYETMMLTDGDDEMMKKEMHRMIKDVERDLKLAFQAAKNKYKETNITHITKLKEGMGIVNTELLTVKSAENLSYSEKKGDVSFCRVVVNDDEGNEGVVYLMDRNSEWLRQGMKIKVIKGRVKSFAFSGETAISVGKKGNIYIVL